MPTLDIIACANGKEALTAIKRFEFEVITTSLALPDMDGYGLIKEIRNSLKNRDTTIFVVSGDTETRASGPDSDDGCAVTAYFNKSEGHRALVNFIINFLDQDSAIPIKVLYVDKSATSTAITSSILKKNNIDFTHFSETAAAFDFLQQNINENNQCTIDILITDLMLSSSMTGFELIQNVRKQLALDYMALPILLMTIEPGADEKTDFTGIFGAGTNDFITKPIDDEDLLNRIDTLVNIKRQHEALEN